MWSKIIEIIEKRWREKPRRDLVRNILEFRYSLIICQINFNKYNDQRKEELKWEWWDSIQNLIYALIKIDHVLSIFSPVAKEHIGRYLADEMSQIEIGATFATIAMDVGGLPWNIRRMELPNEPNLDPVIQKIDEFIRDKFKPEEIQSALNSSQIPAIDPIWGYYDFR